MVDAALAQVSLEVLGHPARYDLLFEEIDALIDRGLAGYHAALLRDGVYETTLEEVAQDLTASR